MCLQTLLSGTLLISEQDLPPLPVPHPQEESQFLPSKSASEAQLQLRPLAPHCQEKYLPYKYHPWVHCMDTHA